MTTTDAQSTPLSQRSEPQRPIRVLVVDDYPAIRALVTALLDTLGYVVEEASNGAEALRTLCSQPPFDVLVTDLQLPGMWGDELACRAREHLPALRVVVMTGEPNALRDPSSLTRFNAVVLRKPFCPVDLFTVMRSVLL